MNCQELEMRARELGRATLPVSPALMDAGVRRAALAHCETCAACATRLQNERALSAGLKALAAQDEGFAPEARLETELLAAFRQQQRVVAPMMARPQSVLAWRRWAVAAAVLLALGLLAFAARQGAGQPGAVDRLVVQPLPVPTLQPQVLTPPEGAGQQVVVAKLNDFTPVPAGERGGKMRKQALPTLPARGESAEPAPPVIRDGITVYGDEAELMTEFISLDAASNDAPLESGQLLRVEVPRQTLARYGLPVNAAVADATVKADLLVGEDGRALAIRFVR